MKPLRTFASRCMLATLLSCCAGQAADTSSPAAWRIRHDELVLRLRNLVEKEKAFGAAYQPLYHVAIPWYEQWGGRDQSPVDADMVSPEVYAEELAGALEKGRNYFAENADALFPLVFSNAYFLLWWTFTDRDGWDTRSHSNASGGPPVRRFP
jgi:hypothetical protein